MHAQWIWRGAAHAVRHKFDQPLVVFGMPEASRIGDGKAARLTHRLIPSRGGREADDVAGGGRHVRRVGGCQDLGFDREGSREGVASTWRETSYVITTFEMQSHSTLQLHRLPLPRTYQSHVIFDQSTDRRGRSLTSRG